MADQKITELDELVSPIVTDVIPVVDDPGGTPITKKSTLQKIADLFKDLTQTLTNKTLTTPKADVINEETGAAGVTIDSLLIKDGNAAKATVLSTTAKVRAYLGANQENLVDQEYTKILLDTEDYDVGGDFANYKFTAPVTGYYSVSWNIGFISVIVAKAYVSSLYKNGSARILVYGHASIVANFCVPGSSIEYLTAGQYLELYARSMSGNNTVDVIGHVGYTYLSVHLLSV